MHVYMQVFWIAAYYLKEGKHNIQFTSTCNNSDAAGLTFGSLPPQLKCKRDD